MTQSHFTYKELLSFGWDKTKQHFPFLLTIIVAAFVAGIIAGTIPVFGDIVAGLVTIAMISVFLKIIGGHVPRYDDLMVPFETYHTTLHYFLALILYILAVICGLVLLILPGIYLAIRLQFFSYVTVEDKHVGPIQALKRSWGMTHGKFWKLFGWSIVVFFVNLAGLLLLGLGLLFTVPITALAYTELYKKLAAHTTHHVAPEHHTEHHDPTNLA